jgi:hypothetical protein
MVNKLKYTAIACFLFLPLSLNRTRAAESVKVEDPVILNNGIQPQEVDARPYLDYVRSCLDMLMNKGADRYGPVQSPILVSILDVRTHRCPKNPRAFDEAVRVSRRERRAPAGANLYLDQPTFRTFYEASRLSGNNKYADFADKSIGYYLENMVGEKDLIWWGYHRHYDVFQDRKTGHLANHHEIHFQQAAWPLLWKIDPRAVTREIEAIWKWHVIDKNTGEINRHDDGKPGCSFGFTGGEFIYAFAFMYKQTGNEKWLQRARLVADYYWNKRSPKTDLVPTNPARSGKRGDAGHFDTSTTGLLCHRLLAAYELTDEEQFRDQALAYLRAYARYGWDNEAEQFFGWLKLDGTPVPGPRQLGGYQQYFPVGHVDLWQPYCAGYEKPLDTAMSYAYASQLTGDKILLKTARRWASCISRAWPPRESAAQGWYASYSRKWAPHGTYAEKYGKVITFFLQMLDLTGETEYLEQAQEAAREAISRLYYRGLFRGHPCKPYYESMDGIGYLVRALLQLHEMTATDGKQVDLNNR